MSVKYQILDNIQCIRFRETLDYKSVEEIEKLANPDDPTLFLLEDLVTIDSAGVSFLVNYYLHSLGKHYPRTVTVKVLDTHTLDFLNSMGVEQVINLKLSSNRNYRHLQKTSI